MQPDQALGFVAEVRALLTTPVLKLGGEVAHRRPDSMLAVFRNAAEDARPNHAQRALHAAILCVHYAVQLASTRSLVRWPGPGARPRLPVLRVTAGVHLGVGELSRRRAESNGRLFAIGEGVDTARQLEAVANESHWSVAATAGTQLAAAGRAERGRSRLVPICKGAPSEVLEITGLVPRKGSTTPADFYESLRFSLVTNSEAR